MSHPHDPAPGDLLPSRPVVPIGQAAPFKIKARMKAMKNTGGIPSTAAPHSATFDTFAAETIWVPCGAQTRTRLRTSDLWVMGAVATVLVAIATLPKREPQVREPTVAAATVTRPEMTLAGVNLAVTIADNLAVATKPTPSFVSINPSATPRAAEINFVPVQSSEQQPAAAAPPSTRPVSREAVQKFVTDFYLSNENLSGEQIDAIYAPMVQYFGTPTSRRAVVREKLAYYRRWPERRFTLAPDTLKITTAPTGPRVVDISFDYEFDVRSSERTSAGRGSARLTLDLSGGEGQIIREEGRVTARAR
jgi:hypothetical protein